jgi:DNA repair exonuclease SbcCD ATPase subunit
MKFYFKKIILWCKNGTKREIEFKPNKVNVITGGNGTGKTAILQIIDYCFFASEHKISEDIINENVVWYGINFIINEHHYTIAREAPIFRKVSNNYYFSSLGEEPKNPFITDKDDKKLKSIIESQFNIDSNVIMPYGAKGIKKDTKISFRYFMLFNTLPYSIIDNEDLFFDKQNKERYRNALERIFDLSLGIETIENILSRETKNKLKEKLEKLKKKETKISVKKDSFYNEIANLFKRAKEYGLINSNINIEDSLIKLKELVNKTIESTKERNIEKYQDIKKEIYLFRKKIDNLKSFDSEYALYKKNLKETEDSLKPLIYLNKNNNEIVKTSIFNQIVDSLENDFKLIKQTIKNKTPLNTQVTNLIQEYEKRIIDLEGELKEIPEEVKNFENDKDKYIFLGEVKAKLELFDNKDNSNIQTKDVNPNEIEDEIKKITLYDTTEQRKLTINLLEEFIQEDIEAIKDALDNYHSHKAAFNYKSKKLELRQPHSNKIVNTGSSSIDMFLHVLMFLGLHKVILSNNVPYIAPYLIMDQPSKPYYGEKDDNFKNVKETDQFKIKSLFNLLDNFIDNILRENKHFQIILFEHVPTNTWDGMKNIYLVEEFRKGNALIREDNKT